MSDVKKKIVVLGIGGGGCKTVKAFSGLVDSDDIQLAVADTDRRVIATDFGSAVQILLGAEWNCETGCGADTELG